MDEINIKQVNIVDEILKNNHCLIAGMSGSGKSVLLNTFINETSKAKTPDEIHYILIDAKKVELKEYEKLPHTIIFADDFTSINFALNHALDIIDYRYSQMQLINIKQWNKSKVYIIIDELADLMTTNKKLYLPKIQRIAQIGRAAECHLICCSQIPNAQILSTQLKVNFDLQIGLHTRTKQDSKNIIGFTGCEQLPKFGKCYIVSPDYFNPQIASILFTNETEINENINQWQNWTDKHCYIPQKINAYDKPPETTSKIPLIRYLELKNKYRNIW